MQLGPEAVLDVRDSGETLGTIVIDSTIRGRARGGLRLMPDVSREELSILARAMTLKYGFLGLPQGGAKGSVLGSPEVPAEAKAALLNRFAGAAAPLLRQRRYTPDADMGTTGPEIQVMLESAGVRVARREHRGSRSGEYTALTVFAGAAAASAHLGLTLRGARIAIEGYGKVGGALAEIFVAEGARLVAVCTSKGGLYEEGGLDVAELARLAALHGSACVERYERAQRVPTAAILEAPADILCPCARHNSIRRDNVQRIPARVVSCGANGPVTEDAAAALWRRGVVCVPDFVANCGGVLGGTMEFAGFGDGQIRRLIVGAFRARVERLLRTAGAIDPRSVAEEIAWQGFRSVKEESERWTPLGTAFRFGLWLYREGCLPRDLVRRFSGAYFERCASG